MTATAVRPEIAATSDLNLEEFMIRYATCLAKGTVDKGQIHFNVIVNLDYDSLVSWT